MHHELRPTDVGIGLGSHDLGVATTPLNCTSEACSPHRVHRRQRAHDHRPVPARRGRPLQRACHRTGRPSRRDPGGTGARNTGENITFTRKLLRAAASSRVVTLISRPYQQRRAYATCKKLWPEVDVICSSGRTLDDYVASIGDVDRVINMLVGDTQRITVYAEQGFAIPQPIPNAVKTSFDRLTGAGFTRRLA